VLRQLTRQWVLVTGAAPNVRPEGRLFVNLAYPGSSEWTAGVIVLHELANACTRRGHEVHFVQCPLTPYRAKRLDELPPFLLDYIGDAERCQRRPTDVLAREDTG
jgi:hypothetical protein